MPVPAPRRRRVTTIALTLLAGSADCWPLDAVHLAVWRGKFEKGHCSATALGLTIPDKILAVADEVIE
jgi:hypothetical protein